MKNEECTNRVTIKSNAASASLLETFAANILGAKNLLTDPGLSVYQLPNGTILEVNNRSSFHPQDIFTKGSTVLSFQVQNIDEALVQMLAAGAKTVDGIVRLSDTYAYSHLIFGDDQIIGIHQSD